jgi:cation-transporting ATPase 13A3/4/5
MGMSLWHFYTNSHIVPFIVTIVATLLISSYMLLDPGTWLREFMDLTLIPSGFKLFILALALGGFLFGWFGEKHVFLWTARLFGTIHDRIWPGRRKVRKEYKTLLEDMRI